MSAPMSRFLATYCRLKGHRHCYQLCSAGLTAHKRCKATTPQKELRKIKGPPDYSIWQRDQYEEQTYTLSDALAMHREYADPAMLDNMDSFLFTDMELSLTTRKKTKFMPGVAGMVKLPFPFEYGGRKEIAVFCTTEEEKDLALKLGATIVGDAELVKMITSQQIGQSEIDDIAYFIATPEMTKAMTKLRPYLKQKTPTLKNGLISGDIEGLMKEYSTCLSYESRKLTDAVGRLQVPIGKVSQSEEELTENFSALVSHLSEIKAPKLDPLIQKVSIIAPPSPETFDLAVELYVEGHEKPETDKTASKEGAKEESSQETLTA